MKATQKTAKQASKTELSWAALARGLGVERNTVAAWWRDRRDTCPKIRTVEAWSAFMTANNLGAGAVANNEAREAKLEQTRLENQILRTRLEREGRKVISRDEVRQLLFSVSTQLRSRVYQLFETELPPKLDGMSSVQMRPMLREEADKLCETMADAVEEFEGR